MKEGYYVIRTYVAGDVGEKTKFFVPGRKPVNGNLSRRQRNAIKKQEQNEHSAVKNLARGINANFRAGDLLIGLDYNDAGIEKLMKWGREKGLPVDSENEEEKRDAIWEAASHELENCLRRVKRRLEKQGVEFKAYYCTSDMDGKTKKQVRVHHHLIVNAGTQQAFLDAWQKYGLGGVEWEPLWENQIDRTPIARYIIDQVRRIPDAKKYRHTKNIVLPAPKNRIVETENELLVPRGGKLIFRQEYQNKGDISDYCRSYQPQYIRYITPAALKRLDKEREEKESNKVEGKQSE